MVLAPDTSFDPSTVSFATPLESVPVPSVVAPTAKVTVPVGVLLPLTALTVAVTTVDEVDAIVVGLAATVVVVAIGAVTVTVAEPLDAAKFPAGT